MLSTRENTQENFNTIEKFSGLILESFETMLFEIAELYRKKQVLLTKEKLLEIVTLYLGYHLVATFHGDEKTTKWCIDLLNNQILLAKQLAPLLTQKHCEKNILVLRNITRNEGLSVPQSAGICHVFFNLIAENRAAILKEGIGTKHKYEEIQYDTGIIMERNIESTLQIVNCLYEKNIIAGYELLLFILFKPILLSALVLAEENNNLEDYAPKAEEYFRSVSCCIDEGTYETIH